MLHNNKLFVQSDPFAIAATAIWRGSFGTIATFCLSLLIMAVVGFVQMEQDLINSTPMDSPTAPYNDDLLLSNLD